jgi:hypothetical protein
MSLLFAFVIVGVAAQLEAPENARDFQAFPSLAPLARLGLMGGIHPVGSRLEEEFHPRVGGLADRGACQHFQLLDRHPVGLLGPETRQQRLDFWVLGQKEFGRGIFFLNCPAVPAGSPQ